MNQSTATDLVVGSLRAAPGEVTKGRLSVASLADGSPVTVPVILVNGSAPGPCVYIQAAQHGPELTGIDAIRRALAEVDPQKLRGQIVAIPVVNGPAFNNRTRQAPYDLEDMNRFWPGRANGSMTELIAFTVWNSAVAQSDVVVDLHTWNWYTVSHSRMGDEASAKLAQVFGTPVLVREELDPGFKRAGYDSKLRSVAMAAGKPAITPELGGGMRLEREQVEMGKRGILNVLKHYGLIEGELELPPVQTVVTWDSTCVMRAAVGGLFLTEVTTGQQVAEGDLLGQIVSPGDFQVLQEFRSPRSGMVATYAENPVLHTGDAAVTVVPVVGEIHND
ncbi:MAG: succinylglutamate desuccinylase/aspartoacylase family protein [Bacillota bacterium]